MIDIQAGNKLIMFFDGAENAIIEILGKQSDCIKYNGSFYPEWNLPEFDKDWRLLMPVVEKIEKDFIVCIWWDCCEISAEKRRMTYPPMLQSRGQNKIQATWDCVIQFIQWYIKETENKKP